MKHRRLPVTPPPTSPDSLYRKLTTLLRPVLAWHEATERRIGELETVAQEMFIHGDLGDSTGLTPYTSRVLGHEVMAAGVAVANACRGSEDALVRWREQAPRLIAEAYPADLGNEIESLRREIAWLRQENDLLRRPMARWTEEGTLVEGWTPVDAGRYDELEAAEAELDDVLDELDALRARVGELELPTDDADDACGCWTCASARARIDIAEHRFPRIPDPCCPECGDRRCAKATDHREVCEAEVGEVVVLTDPEKTGRTSSGMAQEG